MTELEDRFRGLKLDSKLGEGAMGEVYLASHPVLKMPLVVKVLRRGATKDLLLEARLAARVAAPQVVPVWHAGEEDGRAYVIQRYVDGLDLAELLRFFERMQRPLPIDVVWHVLLEVARGLQEIHQAGVVHRDLKPANVFLAGDGSVCIGDFGLAAPHSSEPDEAPPAGTPQFMAPEQWAGEGCDRRTDLYALGGMAHQLLTGEFPFPALSLMALRVAHLDLPYEPPPPRSPKEAFLFAVISRLLEKEPAARYPDARSVARELEPMARPLPPFEIGRAGRACVGGVALRLVVGDLAEAEADVIVNAANSELTMRLGVADALRLRGGDEIEGEARASAPVPMGEVVWTGAGRLRAQRVAHAVAAMDGAISIRRCTLRALLGAEARRLRSAALPSLGTGVGQVPAELAAKMMLDATRTFSALRPAHLRSLTVVLHSEEHLERWRYILEAMG